MRRIYMLAFWGPECATLTSNPGKRNSTVDYSTSNVSAARAQYEVVSGSSRTVTVVTSPVKDAREAKLTLPKAYCTNLPGNTAL